MSDREQVVIIGAGLGGLSAALVLTGAGVPVRILDERDEPGGLMGSWESGGYRFDTGPTVLTMPSLIEQALASVGENMADWLTLVRLSPTYSAQFADGSVLRSYSDSDQMAEEVARVCGAGEARGYLGLIEYLKRLYDAEFGPFMASDLDSLIDLVRPEALTVARLGGLRRLDRVVGRFVHDDRLRRLFTFQALYAGVAPSRARAIYAIIAYLDSVGGAWFPRGGMHQVAAALAGAAVKHGARIDYGTTASAIEIDSGRVRAVRTAAGERIPATAAICNGDLLRTYAQLLPERLRPRRLRRAVSSPSAFVWHVGSRGVAAAEADQPPAHHRISFGTPWAETFAEIIRHGRLMSDPSLLITNPTATDPSLAPRGGRTFCVLAPCPNVNGSRVDWARLAERYSRDLAGVLRRRGVDSNGAFSDAIEVSRTVSPADWQAQGLAGGSPFALAHTVGQTGPLRHPTRHPAVPTLLFCGAGVQPGVGIPTVLISGRLAAQRILSDRSATMTT